MDERFRAWLIEQDRNSNSLNTYLYHLRAIEDAHGDIDKLFDADQLSELRQWMSYTAQDERDGRPNPSGIEFNGSVNKRLASYRTILKRYIEFREEIDLLQEAGEERLYPENEATEAQVLAFRYEQDLQTALATCIDQIEHGMHLAADGIERTVPSGRIDALALDSKGLPVVIELKAVTAKREVLGQIAAYMADIEEETGKRPRGFLIAPDFDEKLVRAARMIEEVTLMRYSFSFAFTRVGERQ